MPLPRGAGEGRSLKTGKHPQMNSMSRPLTFMVAVLYGMSWRVGPLSVLAAVFAASEGRSPTDFLSTIALAFGLILFIHYRMGWPPFRR